MATKIMKAVLLFVIIYIVCYTTVSCDQTLLNRFVRANKRLQQSNDCRYEKDGWEECDPTTGLQRRALRLKFSSASANNCDAVKYIQRSCKINCRYSKGVWSECTNGFKHRIDSIKTRIASNTCESTRNVTKTCKENCNYVKSEWSQCDNGVKTKTLTLTSDGIAVSNGSCEQTKQIRKQCGHANQRSRQRQRAQRKHNISSINS